LQFAHFSLHVSSQIPNDAHGGALVGPQAKDLCERAKNAQSAQ
jgi:hypothetical protein